MSSGIARTGRWPACRIFCCRLQLSSFYCSPASRRKRLDHQPGHPHDRRAGLQWHDKRFHCFENGFGLRHLPTLVYACLSRSLRYSLGMIFYAIYVFQLPVCSPLASTTALTGNRVIVAQMRWLSLSSWFGRLTPRLVLIASRFHLATSSQFALYRSTISVLHF